MTTTSIAGTGGDGAVTMAALTSIPTFTLAFGSGTRQVEYTVEDTTVGAYKFEEGMGVVAANVLTRSKVRATWNGTTYDDTAPAALAFGATPTTGVIRIRLAPHAHEFIHAPPGIVTGISGDTYDGYQFSAHLSTGGNPSSYTLVALTEYYLPFKCLVRGQVDGILMDVNAAVAATGIKAGLYECDGDGRPGPNITRFNALSSATTGVKTDTVPSTWAGNVGPLRFGVSWFYFGFFSDGALTLSAWTNNLVMYPPTGRKNGYGWGSMLTKTNENSYATGMPSGTPTGTYTMVSAHLYHIVAGLKITN